MVVAIIRKYGERDGPSRSSSRWIKKLCHTGYPLFQICIKNSKSRFKVSSIKSYQYVNVCECVCVCL
jgi:hypothetical protein